jgi:CDP-diacylglycerol--glycerol-3-phosphate 3-phosphatidyltransferase
VRPFGLGWPNIVSVLRALLTPLLVWLILRGGDSASYIAAAVFAVGAFSDALDGYLARRHGMVTATGIWLDPLSDKIFVGVPVVAMAASGTFPVWAATIILAREVAVSILRAYLSSKRVSMPASIVAKAKTAAQLLAIALYLLPLGALPLGADLDWLRTTVLLAAVGLTVYSGIDYFVRMRPVGVEP